MLHYLHIVSMCVAAAAVCWGLALLWQADVKQVQCRAYLWVVFLPVSYLVQLNNIKAYRLMTFLTYQDKRPKPFSHGRVLKLTMLLVLVTVIVLLTCSVADPPTRHRVVTDIHRPKLDYYYCKTNRVTPSLLYLLVIGHLVFSIYCVVAVRNGMDAFKDGMIIKESFIALYACLLVSFVLSNLSLSAANSYMLRSIVLSVGVTLFCFRMLIRSDNINSNTLQ